MFCSEFDIADLTAAIPEEWSNLLGPRCLVSGMEEQDCDQGSSKRYSLNHSDPDYPNQVPERFEVVEIRDANGRIAALCLSGLTSQCLRFTPEPDHPQRSDTYNQSTPSSPLAHRRVAVGC